MNGSIFNRFCNDFLSAFTTESSILAYSTRLRHLEPLAESRFSFSSVKDWSNNLQKAKSQRFARELMRLANLLLNNVSLEKARKKMGFANLKKVVRNYESVIVKCGISVAMKGVA